MEKLDNKIKKYASTAIDTKEGKLILDYISFLTIMIEF